MVQEAVKEVVLKWAQAPDFSHANHILSSAREALTSEQLQELHSEVAEINVESFVQLLTSKKPGDDANTIEVEGVALNPQQLKRVSAWLSDQASLAASLGLSQEQWTSLVGRKMNLLVAAHTDAPQGKALDLDAAQRLLGASQGLQFQERPESGKGFASLLAARSFKKE